MPTYALPDVTVLENNAESLLDALIVVEVVILDIPAKEELVSKMYALLPALEKFAVITAAGEVAAVVVENKPARTEHVLVDVIQLVDVVMLIANYMMILMEAL